MKLFEKHYDLTSKEIIGFNSTNPYNSMDYKLQKMP